MRGFIVRAAQSAAGAFVVAPRHSAPASVAATKVDADFMLSPFIVVMPEDAKQAVEAASLNCAGCAIRRPTAWAAILQCSNSYCVAARLFQEGEAQRSLHPSESL